MFKAAGLLLGILVPREYPRLPNLELNAHRTAMADSEGRHLKIALVTDVFPGPEHATRLRERLAAAKARQAKLAVLPEIPMNEWSPATQVSRDYDAELPGGKRERQLSAAAAECGIAVLGGTIRCDPSSGMRYNTALLIDKTGVLAASYEKLHLPEEEGFWETSHYVVGRYPPQVTRALGVRLGVQICSDANRPVGAQLLAAEGVEVILAPRATSDATYDRWRLAYRAMALTASAYVVSVNRPGPEAGVPIGGPSLVVDPEGAVILETTDPVAVATLDLRRVAQAKRGYPGYLAFPTDVYAHAWHDHQNDT